jgi:hypothetical protein
LTLSDLSSSSLFVTERVEGDARPLGDVGEIPFSVCEADAPAESGFREFLSGILVSEALLVNLLAPRPFFCLNFSSQLALVSFKRPSLWFTPVANLWACSVIAASVRARPFLWLFLTQTERAFSISGNLPLVRFTGDKLRSSGNRYFSL